MAFISWEQGNKGQIFRETGEQRQYWGTGNISKQIFDFWGTGEQANLFQGNKGTGTPSWEGLIIVNGISYSFTVNPCHSGHLQTGTLANSEDTDEMPHNAAFHQGLHCLQR